MKKLLIVAALCIALPACEKQGTGGGIDVNGVQQAAIKICAFEPTAQTVLNIFGTGSTLLDSISEIASAVCQAVNTPRSAGTKPTVAGVVVEGRRV